ncbi:hypothetical protein IE994_06190 [Enterobacter hormaechei]|nr:hypothetical protein [Enterobacter hormaechei]
MRASRKNEPTSTEGIAERNFERKFQLAENIHVKGANLGERPAVYRTGTCDSGREKNRVVSKSIN